MILIVGLGNPGDKFLGTRHNIGRETAQSAGKKIYFPEFKFEKKWNTQISERKFEKTKTILLLPDTFMNKSGNAVGPIAKFYKIKPTDIWVIHDDLDLPLGKIKIQRDRSAAGHNGVQSIIDLLGTQDFIRFRIGIASAKSTKKFGADFVLSKFSLAEDTIFKKTLATIVEAIKFAIDERIEKAMTKYN